MKPAAFDYYCPDSLDEAVALLADLGDEAKVLAGGQSLVALMNLRMAQPSALVDLNLLSELAFVRDTEDGLAIGAMTRHDEVAGSAEIQKNAPMLAHSAGFVGYPAIRARGTIGGSLAHADPVSEFPCVCLALDAHFEIVGSEGRRTVAARDFFISYFTTALEPGEILATVQIPKADPAMGWSFLEVARKTGDFALAAVAASVTLANDGTCAEAAISIAGGADRPVRAVDAEQLVVGSTGNGAIEAAAEAAAASVAPSGDAHSSAGFRKHLIRVLTERALKQAWDRGGGQ